MSLTSRITEATRSFLGVSAYAPQPQDIERLGLSLDEDVVEQIRKSLGGNLSLLPTTRTRWYLADLESCQIQADRGDMSLVGQLCRSFRRDGLIGGLMSTRTSGLVALPRRFRGYGPAVDALSADNASRSIFDELCPPSELALMAEDGIGCGVSVGELVPVQDRSYPTLVRLSPEYLSYRWQNDTWFYRSAAGLLPITPGDGRWVFHTPGGRLTPWQSGHWLALGRSYINKEHALLHRANFSAKLANPARVSRAPQGSTEVQRQGFIAQLLRWGLNSVIELPVGWDAFLLESNGRGWEVFSKEIDTSDLETMIVLAGQVVTVTGGTGFANADIHKTIRADLIKQTGDALAYSINCQILPAWQAEAFGIETLDDCARVEWDTKPPEDQATEAQAMVTVATAIQGLINALSATGLRLDVEALLRRAGIPLVAGEVAIEPEVADPSPAEPETAPTVEEAPPADPPEPKEAVAA